VYPREVNTIRKFVALLLLVWTPLFFSAAAYAATQMELANVTAHEVAHVSHACHHMDDESALNHHDITPAHGDSHCQHCGFCVSFLAPLFEVITPFIPQTPALASNAMWVSSPHNITPDHRPPIDA
jgi:hypothetical protein